MFPLIGLKRLLLRNRFQRVLRTILGGMGTENGGQMLR